MSEAVVVLTPDCAGQEDVERCNRSSPRYLEGLLDPLAVLIDHRIDLKELLARVSIAVRGWVGRKASACRKPSFSGRDPVFGAPCACLLPC